MEEERKPWLLYFTGENLDTQTFCSISDPTKCNTARIPEWARTSRIRTVQHGWYLWEKTISKNVSSFILWNPLNHKKIMLPPLKHNGTPFGNCILTSPPTRNDEICSIYLFCSRCPSIFYYQLGDKQCTKVCFYDEIVRVAAMEGEHIPQGDMTCFSDPVYCNGCLYAGMRTGWFEVYIVVIEKLQPNGFTLNITPNRMGKLPATSCFEQHISHLIGFNNALFRIEIMHALDRVTAVFVYKFYCTQRVWEKVESVKDTVFFISSVDSAFACQATNPETEGGRVYIALKDCNFFYIYNIEDRSLVTSQHFSNLSARRSYSRWFMPDTRYFNFLVTFVTNTH
ncbi:putative galactose oxidase/kelch, beta-propeller [Medicago truncatula]|uniref:Putative galactose oxidase/kelch, beta-propeller n=1 Tax=Medicago truncatula TaxID=3880 RepID=A0A396J2S3_MEDTR|nr:putative galactose oxidase/kelch, beta-propeller [Medicago truncatula]